MGLQLVEKYDFETMPLHTEYELTEKGKSLMPILKDLNQWGKEWMPEIFPHFNLFYLAT